MGFNSGFKGLSGLVKIVVRKIQVHNKQWNAFVGYLCILDPQKRFPTYSVLVFQHKFVFKVKVKCTLVQALRLCTGRTAHRGSKGIALPFHDHGTRRVWGVSVTPRPLLIPGKDPVPIVQEAGWASGPVWTGAENLDPPTGIRSPDRPARSQSLYRLSYRAHTKFVVLFGF